MLKKIVLSSLFTCGAFASPIYTFSNVSINHLDWSSSTQNKTNHKDFTYLELEGGAGYNWGDFYGFIDIENPTKNYNDNVGDEQRYVLKPIFDIKLYDNISFHLQDYYFKSKSYYVNNLVAGISYLYRNNNFWIRPALGIHNQTSTYSNGMNGYMFRWVLNYDFTLFQNNLSLSQWHEIEFDRAQKHYQFSDGKSTGTNGALSLWWHINKNYTTGIQYRYANHKLGYDAYQNATIYTLKYNF